MGVAANEEDLIHRKESPILTVVQPKSRLSQLERALGLRRTGQQKMTRALPMIGGSVQKVATRSVRVELEKGKTADMWMTLVVPRMEGGTWSETARKTVRV